MKKITDDIKEDPKGRKKLISMNLADETIEYLDDQAKLRDLNRTQMLRKIILKYRKKKEEEELKIIEQMARLNLRNKEDFSDKKNDIPLEIIFKNLKEATLSPKDTAAGIKYQIGNHFVEVVIL